MSGSEKDNNNNKIGTLEALTRYRKNESTTTTTTTQTTTGQQQQLTPYQRFNARFDADVNYVSGRMAVFATVGTVGGAVHSLWKGTMMGRAVSRTAMSCIFVGSWLFSAERMAAAGIVEPAVEILESKTPHLANFARQYGFTFPPIYASYALGGAMGGAFVGHLYSNKPRRGAVVFTPMMIVFAFVDSAFEEGRRNRITEHLKERQQG